MLSSKSKVTIRTVVQTIAGLAVIAPVLVDQVGGAEAAGWLASVVVVAGIVTRFMASEPGQKLMGFLNTSTENDSVSK